MQEACSEAQEESRVVQEGSSRGEEGRRAVQDACSEAQEVDIVVQEGCSGA